MHSGIWFIKLNCKELLDQTLKSKPRVAVSWQNAGSLLINRHLTDLAQALVLAQLNEDLLHCLLFLAQLVDQLRLIFHAHLLVLEPDGRPVGEVELVVLEQVELVELL